MRIANVAVLLGLTSLIACSGEPDPVVEKAEPIRDGSRLDDIDSLSSAIVEGIGIGIGGPPTTEPQMVPSCAPAINDFDL